MGARVPTRETGGRERGAGFVFASRSMASDAGREDAPTDATYTVSAWRQTEDDPAPWERTLAATPEVTLVRGDDSSRDDASTFDASAYYSRLRTRRDGRALLTARELPSTQNLISDNAAHAPGSLIPGAVCVADAQVSGKGRGGNEWSSPPGCLMFSLLTRHREGRTLPFIQYIATMAAVDAIQEGADDALIAAGAKGHRKGTGTAVDAKIKWPNDLYSGGLKIGGVLCTSTYSDGGFDVVVGADVLYGKSRDFDALFATARLLLENAPRENAPGVFVTAYQHRASHRSIESSLATYGLVVRRAFRYPAEGGVTVDVVEITLAKS